MLLSNGYRVQLLSNGYPVSWISKYHVLDAKYYCEVSNEYPVLDTGYNY
jgi:hypothetical protein